MISQYLLLFSLSALSHGAYIRRNTSSNVVWDGRISNNATQADFDSSTNAFKPDFTKGQNVTFSQLVVFPSGEPSLFDREVGAKSIEVTINDNSIFKPGSSEPQSAVRRAELMPNSAKSANNITTTGIKTLHFSMKLDPQKALNLSHEYLMVFLERADFAGDQFMLKTGTLIGSNGTTKNDLMLLGNSKDGAKELFKTPFTADAFTNFALRMDFGANTIQVFSSTGNDPLTQKTEPLTNDLSGNGDLHFGMFKNPTDPGADSLRSGFQESGINEGIIYGGIFVEDSASGTITLS